MMDLKEKMIEAFKKGDIKKEFGILGCRSYHSVFEGNVLSVFESFSKNMDSISSIKKEYENNRPYTMDMLHDDVKICSVELTLDECIYIANLFIKKEEDKKQLGRIEAEKILDTFLA